ncbi:hypothetical protein CBR_g49362 [Chara braunii]|uniref:CCHC-type domain-containing protein n=1 Tax=Chara braunii TaxID=69332 RepID=A0A388M511_CHABU|nr:hypothetical protein CBR_g49362 [Chara braunii]|eukprot:GBG89573.1 hypothetical protein CBR_g49362 [Chara braunii]
MSGSNSQDYGCNNRRDRYNERGRDEGHDGGCDQSGDGRRDRVGHYGSSSQPDRSRDPPRRFVAVCYECGKSGHYRNQCPKLGGEVCSRDIRQRHQARHHEQRATSEDPAIRKTVEELVTSVATMKEFIDTESARKEQKAKRKAEKHERKKREEEERRAAEEARIAEVRRAMKEEKLKRDEKKRERMRKEMNMEISLHMGDIRDALRYGRDHENREQAKGKQKVETYSSDEEYQDSYESDFEALSSKTENLVITKKCKRSTEKPVGDSPPMESPAKRTADRWFQLGCRHSAMKKSPQHRTPAPRSTRRKIPTAPGSVGKLKFITDNLQALANLNADELRHMCLAEDVQYEGKKMQAILAITEKRTQVVYSEEDKHDATDMGTDDVPGEDARTSDDEGEDES